MTYSQANRPLRVRTPLGEDALLLAGITGLEGVSMPFSFRLDLVSEDDAITADRLLRQGVAVTLVLPGGEERVIHGLVRRFVQEGGQEELTLYEAEIVPWLWFLSLSRESRIYQNLTVPEILESVFRRVSPRGEFELRCTRAYPRREFCVQYRESHLDFVSRLMEEEGIFYFFEHSADKHVLVVADGNEAVRPCPGIERARMAPQSEMADDDVVEALHREETACVGRVVLRDYDYLQPSLTLEGAAAAAGSEEAYDYPGDFAAPDEGERFARIRMEEAAALRQVVRGQSTCRGFRSGFRFDLTHHAAASANQPYMLLQVQHVASAGDFRTWDASPMEYRNHFLAIPHAVAFRPRRATPHPVVRGAQTALVVGPAGEEVWVDRHGRIKVQFYWDREGRRDENSSCWVRVSQPWAGKGWGAVHLPRIGNEVVVEFLEGDPDRPIVTGCVYNAEQTPPFELPGAAVRVGMRSRSSRGGGGYNEISVTDTRGAEAVTIHAQHDLETTVLHDESVSVGEKRAVRVGADDLLRVGRRLVVDAGDEIVLTSGKGSISILADGTIVIRGKDVKIEASGAISGRAASTVALKGSQVTQN
jgi:type VI secretion system secreted protein VgrG